MIPPTLRSLVANTVREALVRHAQEAFVDFLPSDLHKKGKKPFVAHFEGFTLTIDPSYIEDFVRELETLLPSPVPTSTPDPTPPPQSQGQP